MSLAAGQRFGAFTIDSLIGVGGMGEVYRAHDARLGRDVALKVLPQSFATDPDRRARLDREARVLASLNHPHIAQIYGAEDSDGTMALVMELVPGRTLAEVIASSRHQAGAQRGLPVADAIVLAVQVAEALEAAHEKGVIHRDLKPANVKVTDDGVIKVLDFGLAKALDVSGAAAADAANSPTLTARATELGMILGTAAYMAPEQARGRAVDKRVDVWAFGCLLYEMLTGARAFQGDDVSDILAAVLRSEPDWTALPAELPSSVRLVLERCLVKDRAQRIADISTARFLLTEPSLLGGVAPPAPAELSAPRGGSIRKGPIAAAVLLAIAGTVLAFKFIASGSPPAGRNDPLHVAILLHGGDTIPSINVPAMALSPDSRQIVYAGVREGRHQLFVRELGGQDARPIAGTEGGTMPFFSPDGRWVAFFAQGKLKKVSLAGSSLQVLSDATSGRGGFWAAGDTIYFVPAGTSGVWAVPAGGGAAQEVTRLDAANGDVSHRWPQLLPGGKDLLFTVWTGPGWDEQQIVAQPLAGGARRVLVRGGGTGRYVAPGYLVYTRANALLAQSMDAHRVEVSDAVPLVLSEQVRTEGDEGAQYAFSDAGDLVYLDGAVARLDRRIVWVDRTGHVEALPLPARHYSELALSADGRHATLQTEDGTHALWIYDVARAALSPLSISDGSSQAPAWSPDGRRVVYRATRNGSRNLFWKATDGTGEEVRLTPVRAGSQTPGSWSPDGSRIAYSEAAEKTGSDIWILELDGDRPASPFLATANNEWNPRFSPDGRWVAYQSDESGRLEVYVRPFPGPGSRRAISTGGGTEPVWAPNGSELFYLNHDAMMAVAVTTSPDFVAGAPRRLFTGLFRPSTTASSAYASSADGRFLRIEPVHAEGPRTEIRLVLNWFEELKRSASASPRE